MFIYDTFVILTLTQTSKEDEQMLHKYNYILAYSLQSGEICLLKWNI